MGAPDRGAVTTSLDLVATGRYPRRRAFLTALGGLLAWPRFALGQQAERTYRVGWLSTAALRTEPYNLAFANRLREVGLVEDRNLVTSSSTVDSWF